MAYQVIIKPAARRDIKKIARPDQIRVIRRLESLSENPRSPGTKKLRGAEDLFRVREGNYRIIYQIQDELLVVLVVKVGHRREIYRR